ncbi:ABC transporter permease [Paenibacillus sp. y28]|uniref:ABC transporter permease n=1 Tax=Paenibacillus sp. y28 TaxID=3129110 RepID=UPI00301AABE5
MKRLLPGQARGRGMTASWNGRQRGLLLTVICIGLIAGIWIAGPQLGADAIAAKLEWRNLAPSLAHPFGTDWLGRDMFTRTIKGLSLSIQVGLLAAGISVLIAAALGISAAVTGRWLDRLVTGVIDIFLSVPHLVSLILISFVMGGGARGVIVGVALTHWPALARIIRAEVIQLRSREYVQISRQLGKSRMWIAVHHLMPHVLPQMAVGLLLLFPHAILHEAAISFLGLGLSPHEPAIGIILSESMRYLSTGMWWLAFFPGLSLLMIVLAFDAAGEQLRRLLDPRQSQE